MVLPITNPAPADFGAASPLLGPWFTDASITIGAPNEALGVPLTFPAGQGWLPPTVGLLSFFIASDERPYPIAGLHRPNGMAAFNTDQLVAVFRLLPEAESRLNAAMQLIPSALGSPPTGTPAGSTPLPATATRARIRYLALELPLSTTDPNGLVDSLSDWIRPGIPLSVTDGVSDPAEQRRRRAAYLGLKMEGSTVKNGTKPAIDRKRPGRFNIGGSPSDPEYLLRFTSTRTATLFAFDDLGFPVDPGAVAAWWHYLTDDVYTNLWAEGVDHRIAPFEAIPAATERRTIHLTDPHGNPLTDPVRTRLNVSNATSETGGGHLRIHDSAATSPLNVAFAAAPPGDTPDPVPMPRIAALPNGTLASTLTVWNGWDSSSVITRDFLRVVIVDVEGHLVGQSRVAPPAADNISRRRAANQHRTTTRINVERTESGPLRLNADSAAEALLAPFDSSEPTRLVAQGLDSDFGAFPGLILPDIVVPQELPEFSATIPAAAQPITSTLFGDRTVGIVHALQGDPQPNVQTVLMEFAFPASLAGAWVRVWSGLFDIEAGKREKGNGGSGIVLADGRCFVRVPLPFTTGASTTPLGMDLALKTRQGFKLFLDLRFTAPAPVSGDPIPFGSVFGNMVICEAGQTITTSSAAATIPSGGSVVTLPSGTTSARVVSEIPSAAYQAQTLMRKLQAADELGLASTPFTRMADGNLTDSSPITGVTLDYLERSGMSQPSANITIDGTPLPIPAPSSPLPGMARYDLLSASHDASTATAAVGTQFPLGKRHESFPHQEGHPVRPAAAEFHSMGMALTHRAALLISEHARERLKRFSFDLLEEAWNNPFPAGVGEPADPGSFVTLLRTVARSIEGETQIVNIHENLLREEALGGLVRDVREWIRSGIPTTGMDSGLIPMINALNAILTALNSSIPPNIDAAINSTARAFDRRLVATKGLREGATSIIEAIKRARDFIYIETPAIDNLITGDDNSSGSGHNSGDNRLSLFQALRNRLSADHHHALKVILCVPKYFGEGIPKPMQKIRDKGVQDLWNELRSIPHFSERVVLFSPNAGPNRTLHLSATTIIIDDMYAFVGSTHLWRRGLSYDMSVGVATIDEQMAEGAASHIRQNRIELIAHRLGLDVELIPENPADLVYALRLLMERDVGRRLVVKSLLAAETEIPPSTPTPSDPPVDVWNPDGQSGSSGFLIERIQLQEQLQGFVRPNTP